MSSIPQGRISSIQYYINGDEDNKRDSQVLITTPEVTKNGGRPYQDGMQDLHMGTTDYRWKCATCLNDNILCPGHPGLIELNYPLQQPFFIRHIIKWLKIICHNCGKLVFGDPQSILKDLTDAKRVNNYVENSKNTNNKKIECPHCKFEQPSVYRDKAVNLKIYVDRSDKNEKSQPRRLYNTDILKIFERVEPEVLKKLGIQSDFHPTKFLIKNIRVPPNTIRPEIRKIGSGRSNLDDITRSMQIIFKINEEIPADLPSSEQIEKDNSLDQALTLLEYYYYEVIKGSNQQTKKLKIVTNTKKPISSIKSRWDGKFGRIRRNLNGRRTDNMCRSFITGDSYIEIDEVGMPVSIARTIQRPEIVREYNKDRLMVHFMNGRKRYPGCSKVKKADGKTFSIDTVKDNFQLEIGDTIWRDLVTGDYTNFGRQPSLWYCSICCHKIRVIMTGEALRMNVLACPLYNAD